MSGFETFERPARSKAASKGVTHGTASTYRSATTKCRCVECTAANTERARRERASRAARLKADPTLAPHGRESTYSNWKCRCPLCYAAHSELMRKRNARNNPKRRRSA